MDSTRSTPILAAFSHLPPPMAFFNASRSRWVHPLNFMIFAIPGLIFGFGYGLYYHWNCRKDIGPAVQRLHEVVQDFQLKVKALMASRPSPPPPVDNQASLKLDQLCHNLRNFLQEKLKENNRMELLLVEMDEKISQSKALPNSISNPAGESRRSGFSLMLPSNEILQRELHRKKAEYFGLIKEWKKLERMHDIRNGLADMISFPEFQIPPAHLGLDLTSLSIELDGLVEEFGKMRNLFDTFLDDTEDTVYDEGNQASYWFSSAGPDNSKASWKKQLEYLKSLLKVRQQLHSAPSCIGAVTSYPRHS